MKLTDINLNDREEIAAAHALLAAILGDALLHADNPAAGFENRADREMSRALEEDAKKLRGFGIDPMTGVLQDPPFTGMSQDPAAVFGGAAAVPTSPTLPPGFSTHAHFSAVAAQLPTAPVGMPGTFAGVLPAAPAPAAYIAPAVHAQTLASVTPVAPANGVELDAEGLPWDARIHASTRTKTQKKVWTARKGINDEGLVARVKAELRAVLGNVPASFATGATAAATSIPTAPLPPAPPSASIAAMPSPVAVASPIDTPAAPTTFEQLMPRMTAAITTGVAPPTALVAACTALGLPSIVTLQQQPQFVPHVWAQLQATYPGLV